MSATAANCDYDTLLLIHFTSSYAFGHFTFSSFTESYFSHLCHCIAFATQLTYVSPIVAVNITYFVFQNCHIRHMEFVCVCESKRALSTVNIPNKTNTNDLNVMCLFQIFFLCKSCAIVSIVYTDRFVVILINNAVKYRSFTTAHFWVNLHPFHTIIWDSIDSIIG